jgi:hypothetical protein
MPEDVIMIAGHATRHTCNDADGTEWDRGKEEITIRIKIQFRM